MAIKKEALDNFFEEELHPQKKPVYSSYRVFDEPFVTKNNDSENKQSYNKSHNKSTTQSVTFGKQLVNDTTKEPITIDKQLVNKVITEHITHSTNNNPKKCASNSLSSLSGLPRKVILAIYQNCKMSGSNTTSEITLDHLSSIVGCNKNCIKTTINRLRKKGFLYTIEYKTGRGGWVIYRLSQFIYLDILKNEGLILHDSLLNNEANKWKTQPITQPITDHYSSGSNIYKTTTNSKTQINVQLPMEWQNINIEPLKEISFSENHLKQLALLPTLSPEIVQNSINAFAFDLEKNGKRKNINGDPINFFMGIFRTKGGYTPPSNYETPQERFMRLWKEKMGERNTESKRVEIEEEVFNLSFNDWFKKFTNEQKMEFLPKNLRINNPVLDNHQAKERAIQHFKKEIWPNIKNKIESGNENLEN